MTYQELLDKLKELDNEKLQQTVTVYGCGIEEYFPVCVFKQVVIEPDVLDSEHMVLLTGNS